LKKKEKIASFFIIILGSINLILCIPIMIFLLDFYIPNFSKFFKENYDWILPSLTLLFSLIIFLWKEYKESKRLKEATKPRLVPKKDPKSTSFVKKFKLINISDNPALNVKVIINASCNLNNLFENIDTKEFSIFDEVFFGETFYDTDKPIEYFFESIVKGYNEIFTLPNTWVYLLIKAYFYDLISDDDLYFTINLKYNNDKYYLYNEKFKINFRIDWIIIYNPEYLERSKDSPDWYIDESYDHDEIINNKKQILKKIYQASNIHPNLVDFDINIYEIKKE